jgi:hypothetical protein
MSFNDSVRRGKGEPDVRLWESASEEINSRKGEPEP